MTVARVSRVAVEVLSTEPDPIVRVSRVAVEVLQSETDVGGGQGSATGTITWAGSATGEAPVGQQGSATGTITWAGTADGANVRSGAATGTITWAGSAIGSQTVPGAAPPSLVDGGLRFEAFTLPNVGTFARKFDLSRFVNSYTIAEKYGSISDGRLDLPVDFAKLAQLFTVDKANHANDVGSTVRVLRGTTPITHFVLKGLDDKWSSEGQTLTGLLEGMDYFLDRALVPNFDYPAAPTVEPDWHYGLPSILFNTDFEDGGLTNQLIHVWLEDTVTAGTWTMTFDAQTTSAMAWNITIDAVQTAIENLPNINDISITGGGTETNPWVIEVIDPAGTDFNVSRTDTLTGGVSQILSMVQGGAGVVDPWERAFNPATGLFHGSYTNFQTSTVQAHGGTTSLYVKGALGNWPESYPGAQQVVSVTGGRTYRASVWVYPLFARKYRFVIRTTDETFIGMVEADLTAGSWQQLSMSVTIPNHIRSIIFRLSCVSNTDGHEFYLDDALLAPGADAATFGKIMGELLTAIQALGLLTWVTKTWSDTLDSAGVAWDRNLVWSVKHRQSLLQLVEYADRWNYESNGIYWSIPNDRFEWGLFNPAGGGADKQNTGLAILGPYLSGSGAGAGSEKIPDGTHYYAEGDQGYWGEFQDSTMVGAWGVLQKSYFNAQGLDTATMVEQATRLVENAADRTDGLLTRLQAAPVVPWTDFKPGDRNIMVNLSPKRPREYLRCMAIIASKGSGQSAPVYDVHWGSQVYLGEAAHLETTRRLVRAFAAQRPATSVFDGRPAPVVSATGGSAPSLVIAPVNAPDSSKARADYFPDGTNDHLIFQQVVNRLASAGGGRILITEGDLTFGGTVNIPEALRIEGMGVTASNLHMASGSNADMFLLASPYIGSVELVGVDLDGHDNLQTSGTWAGVHVQPNSSAGQLIVDTCHIHDFRGYGIYSDRSAIQCMIDSSQIYANTVDGLYFFVEGLFVVANSWIHANGRYGVKADGAQMTLIGNRISDNVSDGFSAGGIFQGSGVIIANNQFIDNGGNGVLLEGYNSVIAGNFSTGNGGNGIQAGAIAGNPFAVTGNVALDNTLVGFYLHGNGGGTASGNVSNLNGQHGILIVDDHWLVQGNRVESNSRTTNNTYDGIQFAGTAADSAALSNQVRQTGGSPAQRYGINIVSGATNAWVAGNDVRGTYGTAAYVDAGTGTVNVWAGTFGDNY